MKRNYYIDCLRAAATYAVILWHCLSPVYSQFGPPEEWIPASILYSFPIRWSVAMFVMISGGLLLDRVEPLSVFYKKRFVRICIPLLTWTLLYALARLYYFRVYSYDGSPQPPLLKYIFLDQYRSLLFNGLSYHLYFVSIILGLYLIAPFLARMMKGLSEKELGLLTLISVSCYSIKFFFPTVLIVDHFEIGSYLVYFITGYYLYKYPPVKKLRWIIYSVGIMATFLMTWLNYITEYVRKGHQDNYYRTDGFFVFAVAIAMFVLFQQLFKERGPRKNVFHRLVDFISTTGYGIFISHPLLISFIIYGHFAFFTFATNLWTLTLFGYRISFIMNNAWGAVVQSMIMMTVLLVFFYMVKKLRLLRYFT
jgi:surface polysaccharide O-acyltransferase-like enzyme